jgi:uncharacterized protein
MPEVVASTSFTVVRDDGSVVCESCRLAASFTNRLRGLLGRKGLASGEGLVIRPAGSIHTFFMRFPIDVVFLDQGGVVVKRVSNLRPWRLAFARGGRDALELGAGEAERRGIRRGDRLELRAEGTGA